MGRRMKQNCRFVQYPIERRAVPIDYHAGWGVGDREGEGIGSERPKAAVDREIAAAHGPGIGLASGAADGKCSASGAESPTAIDCEPVNREILRGSDARE